MVPPESAEARPSGDEDGQDARGAALQAPWRAAAEALAHREHQVEAAAMNQQTLQDVVVRPFARAVAGGILTRCTAVREHLSVGLAALAVQDAGDAVP